MAVNYNELYEGLKASLEEVKTQTRSRNASYDRIIKLQRPDPGKPNNEYMFRLLPYIKEGKEGLGKSFFYYAKYFWKDELGQYHSVLSRKTFNEPCTITRYYYNIQKNGSPYEQEKLNDLSFKQGWYCNVYVVHDPINPANNGKTMILSLSKTMWVAVQSAMKGELDAEWSARATDNNPDGREIHVQVGRMITDLSDNGVNFSVKVGRKGPFPEYIAEFTRRDARLGLSDLQQQEILDACVDCSTIEKEVSADDINKIFNETYLHHASVPTSFTPTAPTSSSGPVAVNKPAFDYATVTVNHEPKLPIDDEIPGLTHPASAEIPATKAEMPGTEDEMDAFISELGSPSKKHSIADNFNFA